MQKIFEHKLPLGSFQTYDDRPDFVCLHTHQIHSTKIIKLDELDIQADGIIFDVQTHQKVAIKTADCMPIILFGNKKIIFLHAGWSGLAHGILKNPLIASIQPYYAFIGPSIHSCHFEVQADFKQNFPKSNNFIQKENKIFF
jgi:copper oxidase (laccase) domain-containing protein